MKPCNEPLVDKNIEIPANKLSNYDCKNSKGEMCPGRSFYKFRPILVMEIVVENESAYQDRDGFPGPGGDTRSKLSC
jgi:hypothetical protein